MEDEGMHSSIVKMFVVTALFVSFAGIGGCDALGIVNIPVDQMKEKYTTSADKYFSYKGMQVRYRDEGTGPVVIMLHGVCSFLETWEGWVPQMKGEFRVIRIDVPGFGITGPAPDKNLYSRDGYVEFLDAFATHLNLTSFSIAGNSLGGYIAWNYALAYPQKVTKLILVDPVGYHQNMPWILSFASFPLIRPFARYTMPRFIFDLAVSQVYGNKSKATPDVKKRYFEFAMREGNKGAYVDIFTKLGIQNESPTLSKDIVNIKVPTLVMWGTKDEWIPFEHFEKWKKDLPSASFIAYEGAGHIPMEEIPEITAQDALKFLR
jgi:pimeloyl-ACP methyl ester carboxylesterase